MSKPQEYKQIYQTTQIVQCTPNPPPNPPPNGNGGIIDIKLNIPFTPKYFEVQMYVSNVPAVNTFAGNILYICKAPSLVEQTQLCLCNDGGNYSPYFHYTNTSNRDYNGTHRLQFVDVVNTPIDGNEVFALTFTFYA